MLEVAQRNAPRVRWFRDDLTLFDAGRTFDLVLMAGNVPHFLAPDRVGPAIRNMARHVAPGGRLVSSFALRPGPVTLGAYDAFCAEGGLQLEERWSTWQREPFDAASEFAVSLHRRAGA